ncbi:MAG: rhodanese-like domain-containing protein [Phycisphaerales bacterium]|nr:rhodanese-like domain-containing protein [Phycisphaerales bacterium]
MGNPPLGSCGRRCGCGILWKAAVILIAGGAIGFADSQRRPVQLGLSETKASEKAGAGNPTPVGPTDVIPDPKPPLPPPVIPAARTPGLGQPAANQGENGATSPAGGAFVPTPAENLKPGHITLVDAFERHQYMGAVFLDARTEDEYATGHIAGAHYTPMSAFRGSEPPEYLASLAKDQMIVVYCGGGDECHASEQVAIALQLAGFTDVSVLHDGYIGWSAMGHPIETGAAK